MRMHIGTVEGAHSSGGGPPPDLDPDNFESDWTASLVAPPAGWASNDAEATYTYTSTGAYNNEIDGIAGAWSHNVNRDVEAMTLIIGYNLVRDNWSTSVQINNGGDAIASYSKYSLDDAEGYYSMPLDLVSGWPGNAETTTAANAEGFVVLAGVMEADGTRTYYRFDSDGAVTVGTNSGSDPGTNSLEDANVVMQNFDFSYEMPGTAGSIRIARTYLGYDEELDQAAIEAIATGWGWV